ncbi:MAG TPA: monovalent cation/H(+) antiporter subunit G [Alkalispirochaeta sp.]|nr:monovalent cation/H(+) antiporter subunit G [Alkalispirochaeta sp.]
MIVEWIGRGVIVLGLLFIATGVYSVLRYREFYSRVVVTAKVDTVGFITILLGVVILEGFSFVSGKVALIVVFEMLTSPLSTHAIAHSAYTAGYRIDAELTKAQTEDRDA